MVFVGCLVLRMGDPRHGLVNRHDDCRSHRRNRPVVRFGRRTTAADRELTPGDLLVDTESVEPKGELPHFSQPLTRLRRGWGFPPHEQDFLFRRRDLQAQKPCPQRPQSPQALLLRREPLLASRDHASTRLVRR